MEHCVRVLKEEFRWRNFGFSGVHPECFHTFLGSRSRYAYAIYRFVMAVYTVIILSIAPHELTGTNIPWGAYLTIWTYISLTIYMVLQFVVTLLLDVTRACNRSGEVTRFDEGNVDSEYLYVQGNLEEYEELDDSDRSINQAVAVPKCTFISSITWMLFAYVSVSSVAESIIYWSALASALGYAKFNVNNIQLHVINIIIVLVEHCLSAIPVRILHVIYPMCYAIIYVIFSVIYWNGDHSRVIYFILDWNHTAPTLCYMSLFFFVLIPMLQLFFFAIYRLKLFLHRRCCQS